MKNTLPWVILIFLAIFFASFGASTKVQVVYQLKGRLFHSGELIKGGYYMQVFDGQEECQRGESEFENLKVSRGDEFFVYDITLDDLGKDGKEDVLKASGGEFWLKVLTRTKGKAELAGLFIKFKDSRREPKFVLNGCDKEIKGAFDIKGDTIFVGDLKF